MRTFDAMGKINGRARGAVADPSAAVSTVQCDTFVTPDYGGLSPYYRATVCPVGSWRDPTASGLAKVLARDPMFRAALKGLEAPRQPDSLSQAAVVQRATLGKDGRTLLAVRTESTGLPAETRVSKLRALYEATLETAALEGLTPLLLPLLGARVGSLGCVTYVAATCALEVSAARNIEITFASNEPSNVEALNEVLARVGPRRARAAEVNVSCTTPTATLIQYAMDEYYAQPFENCPDMRLSGGINRGYHGVLHAVRTCLVAEMFVQLYQRHAVIPELSTVEAKLLQLAVAYHDSANRQEDDRQTFGHALNFRVDMSAMGFDSADVEPFASAMESKDTGQAWQGNVLLKGLMARDKESFYRSIIHDADCLEILRVQSGPGAFNPSFLHLADLATEDDAAVARDIATVVQSHAIIIRHFGDYRGNDVLRWSSSGTRGGSPHHLAIEASSKAYEDMRAMVAQFTTEQTKVAEPTVLEMFGLEKSADRAVMPR